ncbi:MAG: glutamate synthase, partial [Planctomycetota bacterium]|nr:glutamate synthase [Planctomycetota bacterium]
MNSLLTRLHSEWCAGEEGRCHVFDLPEAKFYRGFPGLDLSTHFHGTPIATPFGPAAGPHTQLAQNLVLSWLAGARVLELKTVQVLDQLEIPRPCIDVVHVGYNCEWSQELTLEQSLEEYVKAAMIIELLFRSELLPLPQDDELPLFDMSVGYDLAGIQSPAVGAFISGMGDCSKIVERLRPQIPPAFADWRDIDFRTRLSDTLTLSTFHGCPADEIAA